MSRKAELAVMLVGLLAFGTAHADGVAWEELTQEQQSVLSGQAESWAELEPLGDLAERTGSARDRLPRGGRPEAELPVEDRHQHVQPPVGLGVGRQSQDVSQQRVHVHGFERGNGLPWTDTGSHG